MNSYGYFDTRCVFCQMPMSWPTDMIHNPPSCDSCAEARHRAITEPLMGDRSHFPLFVKWFPDVPINERYYVMAVHIEEALKGLESKSEGGK